MERYRVETIKSLRTDTKENFFINDVIEVEGKDFRLFGAIDDITDDYLWVFVKGLQNVIQIDYTEIITIKKIKKEE